MVHWVFVLVSKSEVGEGVWEVVDWLVEVPPKIEVD